MSAKHFVDDTENLVVDALESLSLANPDLILDKQQKTLRFGPHDENSQVSLISGGGAGHEPAHAAFVGEGLLTAAVSGNIFASPSVSQILSAIRAVGGTSGVLLILKNYTGDVFHFLLAAEKARALYGLQVETLIVGDDVSVGKKRGGKVGRRGLAGTVLVHKSLGAMAAQGKSLLEIKAMGEKIVSGLATVGVSLNHVHIPGRPSNSMISLGADELELGMGIHNEPGCKILSPRPSLSELVDTMLGQLLDPKDADRAYVDFANAGYIVLLVNNLGGLSVLELSAITTSVVRRLEPFKITPKRIIQGTLMTSLDGPGFSITLLAGNEEIITYLNAPCSSPGWTSHQVNTQSPRESGNPTNTSDLTNGAGNEEKQTKSETMLSLSVFISAVSSACRCVIAQESLITEYDTIVGDGDCGSTLTRGAEAILKLISSSRPTTNALGTMIQVAETIEESMDGTSGAIFGIFFNALAAAIRTLPATTKTLDADSWALIALSALASLKNATAARVGDRTLMDALEPFILSLQEHSLEDAVKDAERGMETTQRMIPAFGRAVYVSKEMCKKVPDPGAVGIVAIVSGLLSGVVKK